MEGQILANMVGYRYFSAFNGTTKLKRIENVYVRVFKNDANKRNYHIIIKEIQKQIQEMSTIPSFVRNYDNIFDLSDVQNAFINEMTWEGGGGPSAIPLEMMCKLYVGSNGLWLQETQHIPKDIINDVTSICGKYLSPKN